MLIDRNLVPQIIFVFFVLPKSSKQEKPEDCIAGKQYWSTSFLNPKGTCAPCPHHWRNCDDQPIGDDYQCRISCRVKPAILLTTPPSIHSSTPMRIPTSSFTPPEHSNVLPNSSTAGPVIHRSTLHPNEPHQNPIPLWVIIVLAVLFALVVVLVVFLLRKSEKRGEIRNVEDGVVLQPLQQNCNRGDCVHEANESEVRAYLPNDEHFEVQNNVEERVRRPNDGGGDHSQSNDTEVRVQDLIRPPVQVTPSGPWVGGIQEENTRLSSLDVHREIHT